MSYDCPLAIVELEAVAESKWLANDLRDGEIDPALHHCNETL